MSSYVDDFNTRNKVLTENFLNKDIDIINFVRRFQSFIGGILTVSIIKNKKIGKNRC